MKNEGTHAATYHEPFVLQIPRYRILHLVLAMLSVITSLVILSIPLYWPYKLCLSVICCVYVWYSVKRYNARNSAIVRRDIKGNWLFEQSPHGSWPVSLDGQHFISVWLIVMHINSGDQRHSLWVLRNCVAGSDYRRLAVYLRLDASV